MADDSVDHMQHAEQGSSHRHQGQDHIIDPFQSVHSPSSETEPSQEPYWHPATPISARLAGSDDIIAETASSVDLDVESDGFELEKVVPPRNAYNLDYRAWIGSIHGTPIAVPANGQCLFLAFYATTTNTQAKKLTLRSATVAAADIVKQRVIDIVLANLRYDVKLRLILPKEELQRIYPGEQPPNSQEAAAAMLYAHYFKMRAVSVGTPVPQAFWEGPTVLRAMAVYLREPVYVWDIDAADRAYVQQYTFKIYEMDNGDQHETGTVTPLSEEKIRDILEACFHQQVIPTMLLLKHTEGHFYGVQHGDTFHEWHAQRGSEMRERLDQVHRLVGLPVLPSAGYDPASVAEEAANEEQALLEEMGVDFYASGSQSSAMPEVAVTSVQRVRVDQHAAVHRSVYERLLTNHDLKAMDAIDSRLAARLHRANDEAYGGWLATDGRSFGIPAPEAGQTPWLASLDWLSTTPKAFRHVLAYLPYPKLAIQGCTHEQLNNWGEREAYLDQLQTLERIQHDEDSDDEASTMCTTWVEQCNQAATQDAMELARDSRRWEMLGQLVDSSLLRLRPVDIPLEHWFLLHTLPYVVCDWEDTAMGRTPTSSRALWYHEHLQLQSLCKSVVDRRDWSHALRLPLGPSRTELTPHASPTASMGESAAGNRH
ncbi:hypothetical protein PF006_g18487 [Phytophthora fragariae]|uniref:OTU domain-containing protein n=1 Tax=Phytophthora fragariae TaxID=53985 RepID=A0A6A3SKF6_9STRA|nr:hypothetical protein PF006_g18487 [Phytophthora fragariae]